MRVAFLGDGEWRADLYRTGAQRKQFVHLLRRGDAASGNEGYLFPFDAEQLEHGEGFFEHARKIKAWVSEISYFCSAQMPTCVAWMLDDDGIGQARFAQPLFENDGDTARIREDRDQRDIRVRCRKFRQVKRQSRADDDGAGAGLARLVHIGGVLGDRPHDVHGDQPIAASDLARRAHLAINGQQIDPVDEGLVATLCRLRHQVRMMPPQIHTRQGTNRARTRNMPGESVCGNAHAHAALYDRQQ